MTHLAKIVVRVILNFTFTCLAFMNYMLALTAFQQGNYFFTATLLLAGTASLFVSHHLEGKSSLNTLRNQNMKPEQDSKLIDEINSWIDEKSVVMTQQYLGEEVIPADVVRDKFLDIATGQYETKANILFGIVEGATDKSLREITPDELQELCNSFKDGL